MRVSGDLEGLRVFDQFNLIPSPDATSTRSDPRTLISTPALGLRSSLLAMTTIEKVDLDSLAGSDPKKAEAIYKSILQGMSVFQMSVGMWNEQRLQNRNPGTNTTRTLG